MKELLDWQTARYGDSVETRAALDYFRERGWPVDDRHVAPDNKIAAFKAGYKQGASGVSTPPASEPQCANEWHCPCDIGTRHFWFESFCQERDKAKALPQTGEPLQAQWQPIETAPKNKAVLVYMKGTASLGIYRAMLVDEKNGTRPPRWICLAYATYAEFPNGAEFSGWMPLPDPPVALAPSLEQD